MLLWKKQAKLIHPVESNTFFSDRLKETWEEKASEQNSEFERRFQGSKDSTVDHGDDICVCDLGVSSLW